MSPRPAYLSRMTDSTLISIAPTSLFSIDHSSTPSTALTSPDLCSPKKLQGQLEPMLEVLESEQKLPITMDPRHAEESAIGSVVSRGPSVRDRATQLERQSQASSSRARPLPVPLPRTRSTSPLRIDRKYRAVTPTNIRRVPIPSSVPTERITRSYFEQGDVSPRSRRTPPKLEREQGSAKRMIQQWESLPSTPAAYQERRPSHTPMTSRLPSTQIAVENRTVLDINPMDSITPAAVEERRPIGSSATSATVINREYLDQKPLPIPRATAVSSVVPTHNYSPERTSQVSPARTAHVPSPLQHLRTPTNLSNRKRSVTLTPSRSSQSLSPSPGEKRKKGGRSPLKDILNKFGGGIQAIGRKAKGKGKDKSGGLGRDPFSVNNDEDAWRTMDRLGTNGLPGGIVFRDRMGDSEMVDRSTDNQNVIRTSAVMYLVPTPCSSLAPWGSWLTSWGSLNPGSLDVTYCPIFHNAQLGNSTPRRVLSGANPNQASLPAVPFSSIPPPEPGTVPDVELTMKDCVEVRSLRREEVKGRGIPAVPEGVGTELLEMVWSDGSKRYLGVEGVGGRLGWVSAIWDVLLACRSQRLLTLPPPSPVVTLNHLPRLTTSSLASYPFPAISRPNGEISGFSARIASLEARPSTSSAPPVQKVGYTVAASAIGTSDMDPDRRESEHVLRSSVQRMFQAGPDANQPWVEVAGKESQANERILAWQPTTERELSIFPRANSKRLMVSADHFGAIASYGDEGLVSNNPKSETVLSFDPNDLNPSRSASQVRRASIAVGPAVASKAFESRVPMSVVPEGGSDDGVNDRVIAPTQVSHVTFPKPTPGRMSMTIPGGLPMSASVTSSSFDTGDTQRTPRTKLSSITTVSGVDPTVHAKLESHSTEHNTIAKQIDGVQVDIHRIISSLGALVQQAKTGPDMFPKALDEKITSLQLNVKGVENALQLSTLAASRRAPTEEPKLVEVHSKLDNIAMLCEGLLAGQATRPEAAPSLIDGLSVRASKVDDETPKGASVETSGLTVKPSEEKVAGEEVAYIMADHTGSSSKISPKLGGIQVLHNLSAPSSPKPSPSAVLDEGATKQVGEVLGLVKELKEARSLQTQQTTDIAQYLNELNSWLEKFVLNSTTELSTMSKRLDTLVGPEPSADGQTVPSGLPDLVADMHSMISDQQRRQESEGMVGPRLDSLLQIMGQEQERQASQQTTVEHVLAILDRQRNDNEMLLRALATDLTSEIRGERIRFVEAMQQATSVNISLHIEEFKKLLSAEVHKSMKELGQMREQKKSLEHQISDLFALKAKHGPNSASSSRRGSAALAAASSPAPAPAPAPSPGPQAGTRTLPAPPPVR